MEYQEFKMMMKERLQNMVRDSVEVTIEAYYKNNQTRIESLAFQEKVPDNLVTISPAINIKDLYELFQQYGDGKELEECLCMVKKLYEEQEPKSVESIINSWDGVALWGIDEATFWKSAEYNLYQEGFVIKSLSETISEVIEKMNGKNEASGKNSSKDIESLRLPESIETHYVMSNKDRNYGAIAMLRTDLLQEFAEKNDSNLFVLPSSNVGIWSKMPISA